MVELTEQRRAAVGGKLMRRIEGIRVATFSLVAAEPSSGQIGVAVASKFLAVGSVVPWVRAGVGAVATQALANPFYGPQGLTALSQGADPSQALADLVAADAQRNDRQAGLVSADGRSATFTGSGCLEWAGGRCGPGFAAQGNILVGPQVIDRMVETFLASTGPLYDRLVKALRAGDLAGGDSRGRQSAAIQIEAKGAGYGGSDRWIDLRVDDHVEAVAELERLLDIWRLYFEQSDDLSLLSWDESLHQRLDRLLTAAGYPTGELGDLLRRLEAFAGAENLEHRLSRSDGLDPVILEILERRAAD